MDEGKRSIWSVTLAEDECEDNHSIAKKLRRIKQSLDKMFTGTEWLPENVKSFMDTIVTEQVRFEEGMVFSKGDVMNEASHLPKMENVCFVTDAFGPSSSMLQVLSVLGAELGLSFTEMGSVTQNENANVAESNVS